MELLISSLYAWKVLSLPRVVNSYNELGRLLELLLNRLFYYETWLYGIIQNPKPCNRQHVGVLTRTTGESVRCTLRTLYNTPLCGVCAHVCVCVDGFVRGDLGT